MKTIQFFSFSLLLLCLFNNGVSIANADFIADICGEIAKGNPTVMAGACSMALKSDMSTSGQKDLNGLGANTIHLIIAKTNNLNSQIKMKLNTVDPQIKKPMQECSNAYSTALANIKEGHPAYHNADYATTNVKLAAALDNVDACKDAFPGMLKGKFPFTKEAEDQARLVKIGLALVKIKENCKNDPNTSNSCPNKPKGMAKPQPKPVMAKPQPKPVMAKPQPKPVMAKPQPKPVMAKPQPKPVMIKPQPKPVMAKPVPKPAMNQPNATLEFEAFSRAAIKLIRMKARDMEANTSNKLATTTDPKTQKALQECQTAYHDALGRINEVYDIITTDNYRATNMKLSALLNKAHTCEDAFKAAGKMFPFAAPTQKYIEFLTIGVAVTKLSA
ncbi:hypothetical protein Sjap_004735 [Stephania japonica]|uniref:Pectinesterase inhibitor domain-containing protein n=1 Tax=Stephania japonica TaxID=461633 RepID=A0AAP0PI29_9MAGN